MDIKSQKLKIITNDNKKQPNDIPLWDKLENEKITNWNAAIGLIEEVHNKTITKLAVD